MTAAWPSWTESAWAVVEGIPDGHDPDDVRSWLRDALPFRDGGLPEGAARHLLGSMRWFRVEQTRRFWDGDLDALQRVATSMAAGLWNLQTPVGLAARWSAGGLDLRIGAPEDLGPSVLRTVAANLRQVQLSRTAGDLPASGAHLVDLCATATKGAPDDGPGLLDRLCALDGVEWSLDLALLPVPIPVLEARCRFLDATSDLLADRVSRQVQLDPHTTVSREDPGGRRTTDDLAREHARTEGMLRSGAFQVLARLGAADPAGQSAVVGAATAAAPASGCHWRALPPTDGGTGGPVPLSLLASTELSDLLRPPADDTLGLPSQRWFPLDAHPEPLLAAGPALMLGTTDRGAPLHLPMGALTDHVLVTGASGSGKSSHLAALLVQIDAVDVPFMVIEPVKNEYRSLPVDGLTVWRPGAPDPGTSWRLNPFEVPPGVSVTTHLDRVVALVRQSLGLPDPLPHLFETALQRAYAATGWDLGTDRNLLYGDGADHPTLSEVLEICLQLPAELGYEPQIQGNLRAAAMARLGGLTRGPRGRLLDTTATFPTDEVLAGPVVVNLEAIGDDRVRAFLVELVLLRVIWARAADPRPELVHVTVIEEGHRVLGAHPTTAAGEQADPVGQAADLVGTMLAEVRASGEGVIVVDQSAGALVRGALVNTSTKISLRSVDRADQQALGTAVGLEADEQGVLSTLARHEALVSWQGMDRPVRARAVARYLVPAPPARVVHRDPVRLDHVPDAVTAAASLLVRSQPAGERAAWSRLLDQIETHLPGAAPEVVVEVLEDVLRREVARLARARRWRPAVREAAIAAVLDRQGGPTHPRRLLLSGTRPLPACTAVCPHGGCLVGELVAVEAHRLSAEGFAAIERQAATSALAHRVRRRVLAVLPATAPPELLDLGDRCLLAQACDPWMDPPGVASVLDRVHPQVNGS